MSFKMLDYGKYIDEGVSGTKYKVPGGSRFGFDGRQPPKGDILKWMKNKKVKARDLKTNKFIKQTKENLDQAAFLISRSIKRKGIPKSEFFQAPFALELERLPLELLKGLDTDLDNILADL